MPTVELDIRQLADEGGTAPIAPITVTDAVLDENGDTLTDILDEINAKIGSGTLDTTAQTIIPAINELKAGLIKHIDISDSTPVNVNTQTGGVVTPSNFVSAVAQDQLVICLPYRSVNIQYLALKDQSLNAVTGSKTIRVYYVD